MKKNKQSSVNTPKLLLVSALIIIFTILFLKFFVVKSPPSASLVLTASPSPIASPSICPSSGFRTFTASNVMDNFTIEVPCEFEVEEKWGTVTLKSKDGKVEIDQNSTNFDQLDDHIALLEKLNKIEFHLISKFMIGNLIAREGVINDEKVIFIYNDYRVYSFSTKEKNLQNVLVRIAKSFKI